MAEFSASVWDCSHLTEKTCSRCKATKPVAAFYRRKSRGLKPCVLYSAHCRACACQKTKAYQDTHRDRVLAYKREHHQKNRVLHNHLKRGWNYSHTYKTTLAAYDLQLHAQNSCCAICLRSMAPAERRFAFDHDHATGLMRGVLCSACNGGLGCFRDQESLLLAALTYLRTWKDQHGQDEAVNE